MASSAIYLMVLLYTLVVSTTKGFRIDNTQSSSGGFRKFPSDGFSIEHSNFPVQPFTRQYENVNEGPIAGYPKVPPSNAYESGGADGDLLPPESGSISGPERRNQFFRRSTDFERVEIDPKSGQEILKISVSDNPVLSKISQDVKIVCPTTGFSLDAQLSWKDDGGNGDTLKLPLEGAVEQAKEEKVDPKTGYPLQAQPHWKDAGGNEDILELPLEDSVPLQNPENEKAIDPKTGYPLQAEEHWKYAGGDGDILELPLEDQLSPQTPEKEKEAVDPKTGYPLKAELHWKDAGGNEDFLEPPLEEEPLPAQNPENEKAVDPKTGYPLKAELHWKDAGGDGDILELPLEEPLPAQNSEKEKEGVDPKTGYPLKAELHWKDAGGNGDILELPLEEDPLPAQNAEKEEGAVDPKTGYPLKAELHWKDAGGNGDFLELPLESPQPSNTPQKEEAVDPKTGYPLKAEPHWKDAGGDGDILELPLETPVEQADKLLDLPLEESTEEKRIDKKTGYPFVAEPGWRDAGGNEENIDLPLENTMGAFSQKSEVESQQVVDPKTNFAFRKISLGSALKRPLGSDKKDVKVDPKTGYPLVAQSEWSLAGGDGNILQLPIKNVGTQVMGRSGGGEGEDFLAQLRPPALESNYYTGFGGFPFSSVPSVFSQTPAIGDIQFFDSNRIPRQRPTTGNSGNSANNRQQKVYTLTYPDNAVLTVSSFSSGNNQNVKKEPTAFTSLNQKQFTQTFSGGRTQNSNGNSFKSFPTTHTTIVQQQVKTSQPSGITNFQQHQIKQSPSFLRSNIATTFT